MKTPGFFLLAVGFLIGAYSTALDVEATRWALFVPAAVAAILGLVLVKRAERGEAQSDHVLQANRTELSESLGNLVRELDDLEEAGTSIDANQLRDEIDDRLREDLRRFADARESLIHLFSLQTYADIMSEFAAGERYVNRVWSASADGYETEARRYLSKAATQFRLAHEQLDAARG